MAGGFRRRSRDSAGGDGSGRWLRKFRLVAGCEVVARGAGGIGGGHVESDLEAFARGQCAGHGGAVDANDALAVGRSRIIGGAVVEIAVALRARTGTANETANNAEHGQHTKAA